MRLKTLKKNHLFLHGKYGRTQVLFACLVRKKLTYSSLAKRNLSINFVPIIITSCTIELFCVRKAFTTAYSSGKAAGAKSLTFRVLSEDLKLSLNVKITSLGEGRFPLNWPLFQKHRMLFFPGCDPVICINLTGYSENYLNQVVTDHAH